MHAIAKVDRQRDLIVVHVAWTYVVDMPKQLLLFDKKMALLSACLIQQVIPMRCTSFSSATLFIKGGVCCICRVWHL